MNTKSITIIDEMNKVQLISIYLVQKQGQPTSDEIRKLAREKLGCDFHDETLERALKGAAKRGIIAIEQKAIPSKDKQRFKVYSMKTANWKQPPEYAHFTDLLPVLIQTSELSEVKAWFDEKEKRGEVKHGRGNDVDNYHSFRVRVMNLDPLLGSQIKCPYNDGVRDQFCTAEEKKLEVDGIWERDGLTGEYIIGPDVMQGWWATNVGRYSGSPDARASYVAFAPVRIRPTKPVIQYTMPVNSSKTGPAAPKPYETIQPGETFEIRFSAPLKGLLTAEAIEKIFNIAGLRPRRGISPARGKRYGKFLVLSFQHEGPVKDSSMENILRDVPPEIMEKHGAYLRAAAERLKDVKIVPNAKTEVEETPFPQQTNGVIAEA